MFAGKSERREALTFNCIFLSDFPAFRQFLTFETVSCFSHAILLQMRLCNYFLLQRFRFRKENIILQVNMRVQIVFKLFQLGV